MKKLLILSGKGGTGKTSIASAFAYFTKSKVLADCDVDAPNLHILKKLPKEDINYDFVGSKKACIDNHKCIGCGTCYDMCHFNAINLTDGKYSVNEYACEGCGLCSYLCPVSAISLNDDFAGVIKVYQGESPFVSAKLKMGRGNSGKLVSAVKKIAIQNSSDQELMIIDGSPGIGCPVVASISGVDVILIVAEPSESGFSDLKRLVESARKQAVDILVCINKYDINETISNQIVEYCNQEKIFFAGKVAYDSNVSRAINQGLCIAEVECKAKEDILNIYQKVINYINDESLKGE